MSTVEPMETCHAGDAKTLLSFFKPRCPMDIKCQNAHEDNRKESVATNPKPKVKPSWRLSFNLKETNSSHANSSHGKESSHVVKCTANDVPPAGAASGDCITPNAAKEVSFVKVVNATKSDSVEVIDSPSEERQTMVIVDDDSVGAIDPSVEHLVSVTTSTKKAMHSTTEASNDCSVSREFPVAAMVHSQEANCTLTIDSTTKTKNLTVIEDCSIVEEIPSVDVLSCEESNSTATIRDPTTDDESVIVVDDCSIVEEIPPVQVVTSKKTNSTDKDESVVVVDGAVPATSRPSVELKDTKRTRSVDSVNATTANHDVAVDGACSVAGASMQLMEFKEQASQEKSNNICIESTDFPNNKEKTNKKEIPEESDSTADLKSKASDSPDDSRIESTPLLDYHQNDALFSEVSPALNNRRSLIVSLLKLAVENPEMDVMPKFLNILQTQKDLHAKALLRSQQAEEAIGIVWSQDKCRQEVAAHEKPSSGRNILTMFNKCNARSPASVSSKADKKPSSNIQRFFKPVINLEEKDNSNPDKAQIDCDIEIAPSNSTNKRKRETVAAVGGRRSKRLQHKEKASLEEKSSDDEKDCIEVIPACNDIEKPSSKKTAVLCDEKKTKEHKEASTGRSIAEKIKRPTENKAHAKVYNSLMWTDKYAPASSKDIIGNDASILELFTWLSSWKHQHQKIIRKITSQHSRRSKKRRVIDSDDDSDDSDDDEDDGDLLCNTVLLTGDTGRGITSSLLACAQELDFKVLELNASSCRSGKEIYQYFGEALQSHQVKHKLSDSNASTAQTSSKSLPNAKGSVASFFQQPHQSKTDCPASSSPQRKRPASHMMSYSDTMSLILLEQADCVFDDSDRGFWQAVNDLRSEAKRPIILTANDPAIAGKFEGTEFVHIHIGRPNCPSDQAIAALQVMCLIERAYVSQQAMTALLISVNYDIRQAITLLQYHCESQKVPLHLSKLVSCQPVSDQLLEKVKEDGVVFTKKNVFDKNGSSLLPKQLSTDGSVNSQEENEEDHRLFAHDMLIDDKSTEVQGHIKTNQDIVIYRQIVREQMTCAKDQRLHHSFVKQRKTEFNSLDCLSYALDERVHLDSSKMHQGNATDCHKQLWQTDLRDSLIEECSMLSYSSNDKFIEQEFQYIETQNKALLNEVHIECGLKLEDPFDKAPTIDRSFILDVMNKVDLRYSLNHCCLVQDLVPVLRTFCCAELQRKETQFKRSRRFLHYLDNISLFLEDDLMQCLMESKLSY